MPGAVPDSLYVECRGDVTALKLFKQGLFHVQGEASQLACAALSPRPGDTVLDLCAAPGGKSATLAQYMENKGTLVSCDAAQNRLTLVGGALERLGVACGRVLHNDAAVYNEAFAGADAVLCDVPCSGEKAGYPAENAGRPGWTGTAAAGDPGDSRALCEAGRAARLLYLYAESG